jgi:8-oxo-dGTP pyrophosphatase MutT (NUDIX family)
MSDKPVGEKHGWILKESRYLWKSLWNRIRQDEIEIPKEGKTITYTYLEHDGSVFVVPYTQDGRFVVIRCYRWTSDQIFWEIPAGIIADKKGMSLEAIAREEMREEAGCEGGILESLGTFHAANGVMDLKMHFFLARDVDVKDSQAFEAGELILERKLLSRDEVKEWLAAGRFHDADTCLALMISLEKTA